MGFTYRISKLLLFALIICVSGNCNSDKVGSLRNETQLQNKSSSSEQLFDFDDIMASCNESFRTSLEYLRELNTTGRFPDETDKTPMCYIRCYFEKLGTIEGANINKSKIVQVWPASTDSVDICQKEGERESNPCMATYAIISCIMTHALVDSKNNGEN